MLHLPQFYFYKTKIQSTNLNDDQFGQTRLCFCNFRVSCQNKNWTLKQSKGKWKWEICEMEMEKQYLNQRPCGRRNQSHQFPTASLLRLTSDSSSPQFLFSQHSNWRLGWALKQSLCWTMVPSLLNGSDPSQIKPNQVKLSLSQPGSIGGPGLGNVMLTINRIFLIMFEVQLVFVVWEIIIFWFMEPILYAFF